MRPVDADEANRAWSEWLAAWAIPEELLAEAAASPFFFDPGVFIRAADAALARPDDTPSDAAARAALPAGGSVLDVGIGAGAASLRLDPGRIIGVDVSHELLEAFAARAAQLGITAEAIEGRWPDIAPSTPRADVVVCHHVAYNASDLASFAAALTAHARSRVVMELTAVHPMSWMAPYWTAMHGRSQPTRPTVDDAVAVLTALGLDVQQHPWQRPIEMIGENDDDQLARIARRLCLPAARYDELQRVLDATPPPPERDVTTLWWPPEPTA